MTTIYDSIMNEITYQDFIKIINNIPSCIFFKDTELKTSLEKVERMNAAQKMFTASMNHELRSPLNGIIGLLKLLLEDNTLNETQHGYVDNAYQSSMMMLQIVNDLLDYAKMDRRPSEEFGKTVPLIKRRLLSFSQEMLEKNMKRSIKLWALMDI